MALHRVLAQRRVALVRFADEMGAVMLGRVASNAQEGELTTYL